MKLFNRAPQAIAMTDDALVTHAVKGDHEAFSIIVSRYQNLLCSLAYAAVGDVKHSEDIAQEVFVDAWKQLADLREPEKLKAWLCGILRFKISRHRRQHANHIVVDSETEPHQTTASDATLPDDAVIAQQQQSLLWAALQQLDPSYREPLVLFYRQEQSISDVAAALELSEDAIKQRLSRGRKLLHSAMLNMVENTLSRSKPGVVFTTTVLAATGMLSPSAKALSFGLGASKASSAIKATGLVTMLAAFSGLVSSFIGMKTGLIQSRTDAERRLVIRSVILFLGTAAVFVGLMFGFKFAAVSQPQAASSFTVLSQLSVIIFTVCYWLLSHRMFNAMRALRQHQRLSHPEAFSRAADQINAKQREYISAWRLFGVPLVHFQFAMPEHTDKPAVAWIAGGSHAYGLLFAWGGFAVAPICVGIVSFGIISIGAVGIGILGLGTVAIGVIAFGTSAIGVKAYSSLSSLAWDSSVSGGFAIAKDAAIGPIAYAEHTNNSAAVAIARLELFQQHYLWLLALIAILVIIPALGYFHKVKRRLGTNAK